MTPAYPMRKLTLLVLNALALGALGGCATKEYVQQEIQGVNQRMAIIQGQVAKTDERLDYQAGWLAQTEARVQKGEADTAKLALRVDENHASLTAAHQRLAERVDESHSGMTAAHQRLDSLLEDMGKACFRIGENKEAIVQMNRRLDEFMSDQAQTTQRLDSGLEQASRRLVSLDEGLKATDQRMDGALLELATTRNSVADLQSIVKPDSMAQEGGVQVHVAPEARIDPVPLADTAPVQASDTAVAVATQNGPGTHDVSPASQPTIASAADADASSPGMQAITAEIDRAAERIASNTQAIESAAERLNTLEKQAIASNTEAITGLTKRMEDLRADVDRKFNYLQNQTEASSLAAVHAPANTLVLAEMAQRLDTLEQGVARQITGLHAQVDAARQQADTAGATSAGSTAHLAKRVEALETDIAQRMTTIQEQAETLDKSVARQQADLSGAGTRLDALAANVSALDQRLTGNEATVQGSLEANQAAIQRLDTVDSRIAAMETRLSSEEQKLADKANADAEAIKRLLALEGNLAGHSEQIAQLQSENVGQDGRLAALENALAITASTAREALERAIAAGKLAQGKLLFQTVITDDVAQFPFGKATLSDAAKTQLQQFGEKLKAENKNVFIEVQGHTDNVGGAKANIALGQARADAVMAYLHGELGIPLHRMSAISYGESRPVASNKTKAGRALNRRVALVVLE